MFVMKRATFGVLLMTSALLLACARTDKQLEASNGNSAPQSNSNSDAAQAASQVTPSSGTPLVVQQIPAATPPASAPQPEVKAEGGSPAKPMARTDKAPKLVAPEKRIDFGKQPQDKNLVRAITIKNGGTVDLKIESVVPS